MTLQVLLVDDQELIRAGLEMIIDSTDDIQVIGQAADGKAAVDLTLRLRPDVVLMTSGCPRWTGSRPPAASRTTAPAC